jgi:hypothetical protein
MYHNSRGRSPALGEFPGRRANVIYCGRPAGGNAEASMSDDQDGLDLEIKRLERDKKAVELERLKAGERTKWVTPTVLLSLLPIIGGLGLWLVSEAKEYNAAYQAIGQVKELKAQRQEINAEIQTLVLLKREFQDQLKATQERLEATQAKIDRAYLKVKFTSSEVRYALAHLPALDKRPDRARLDSLTKALDQLPKEVADAIRDIIRQHDVVMDIAGFSENLTKVANDAVQSIPAGEWAQKFQLMPTGAILPGRKIMVRRGADGPAYYDVDRAELMSAKDVEAAGGRAR